MSLSSELRYLLELIGARKGKGIGPPSHSHQEDVIDSDDKLIGAFDEDDEEEIWPDKSDSDGDNDIVVSTLQYAQKYNAHLFCRFPDGRRMANLEHMWRHVKPHIKPHIKPHAMLYALN